MKRKDMEIYLERLEAVKAFIESHPIAEMQEEMVRIEEELKRFGTLAELMEHLEKIESIAYTVKDYLTLEEAAQYLCVSKSKLYKLTATKEITVFKPAGRHIYIHRDELFNWISKNPILSDEALGKIANLKAYQIEQELKRKRKSL